MYGAELRNAVEKLSEQVGFGLTRDAVKSVVNVEQLTEVRDMAKLAMVMEKLENLARGVARLRAAAEKVGAARYQQLCQDLNLPSDSIDDIPDCRVLRTMVDTLESEAGSSKRTEDVHKLCGRLLQQARKVAKDRRVSLGQVIETAAKGAFTLATIKKVTDAGVLNAALRELTGSTPAV